MPYDIEVLFGTYYTCEMRDDFDLCVKCIKYWKDIHDPSHKLLRGGIEMDEEVEEEPVEGDTAGKRVSIVSRHVA